MMPLLETAMMLLLETAMVPLLETPTGAASTAESLGKQLPLPRNSPLPFTNQPP